jgi:hypothetical protein
VTITWTPVAGATGYRIERRALLRGFVQVGQVGAETTTFVDTGVTPGVSVYRVRAITATGTKNAMVQLESSEVRK